MYFTEMSSQSSSVSSTTSASDTGSCNSSDGEVWPMKRTSLIQEDGGDDDEKSLSKPVGDARLQTGKRLLLTRDPKSTITMVLVVVRWLMYVSMGLLVAASVSAFSIRLPFFLAPWAAQQTYLPAFYQYDPLLSFFDNTAWTYGTDYGLAIVMTSLGVWLVLSVSSPSTRTLRLFSACLLWSYAISVTAGGIAHQFYFTAEQRNTLGFRALWALCVGSVTAASGWMGCIGTELLRQLANEEAISSSQRQPILIPTKASWFGQSFVVPVIPEGFWVGFGLGATLTCMLGYMSFQRPACDIFVAGTTQTLSSFYMMSVVGWSFRNHPYVRGSYRAISMMSWILNAPLLPLYPLLIQYTDWSLAKVNTFLHCWLLVAWGLQGCALQHYTLALHKGCSKPTKAIPLKKHQQQTTTKVSNKEL